MSNSREISYGRRAPQRSVFVSTCNILSRYIKEKGSLKDFNLEIDGKIECLESLMKSKSSVHAASSSTMNLLTRMEKSAHPVVESSALLAKPDSCIIKVEDSSNEVSTRKEASAGEPMNGAPLTIFYAGRVLVFDNCPADKAKELVMLASKRSSRSERTNHCGPLPGKELTPNPNFPNVGGIEKARSEAAGGNGVLLKNASGTAGSSSRVEVNGSDLPIARRSSVHRFLEKRRERAAAIGPYQVQPNHEGSSSISSKGDVHLDLKL